MNTKDLVGKAPALTVAFWLMKIAATTLGETAGDLLSMTLQVGYAASSAILLGFFVVTLAGQLWVKSYHPLLFWLVILSTSTAGTTISDFLDRTAGLGYATGSGLLLGLLVLVFISWRLTGESFSVSRITSRRGEVLYWLAILVSNTLGTALGDFLADDSGLGFAGGAAVIGAVLLVLSALYRFTSLSRVLLFWAAFILTRPFGATVGDFLTKGKEIGGLGLGTIGASAVLLALLLGLVAREIQKQKRATPEDRP